MGYSGGGPVRRRGRREGHGLFGRPVPDRQPRDAGVEWIRARRALARVSGDPRRPGHGAVAQSGRLRERSKILVERRASPPGRWAAQGRARRPSLRRHAASSTITRVIPSLLERQIEKRPDKVRLKGRILFLTEDPELIKKQLAGWDLPWDTKNLANNPKLRDDISTDEITPAHYCFYFDRTLGEIPYVGLRCGETLPIGRGDVKKGGFVCSVSGKRRGKGSSREQSPYAEMCAGIQVAIGENIERIYQQNCQNLGLLTSTNFSLVDRIRAGEEIALSEFTVGEDEITKQVIEYGGLFPFNVARMQGKVFLPPIKTEKRAMTLAEKIFARHMVSATSETADLRSAGTGESPVPTHFLPTRYVRPGDTGFTRVDLRFSHEYVTPMASIFYEQNVGKDAAVRSEERR